MVELKFDCGEMEIEGTEVKSSPLHSIDHASLYPTAHSVIEWLAVAVHSSLPPSLHSAFLLLFVVCSDGGSDAECMVTLHSEGGEITADEGLAGEGVDGACTARSASTEMLGQTVGGNSLRRTLKERLLAAEETGMKKRKKKKQWRMMMMKIESVMSNRSQTQHTHNDAHQ